MTRACLSGARPGGPTPTRRSPTSLAWRHAGWPGSSTGRPTGRRCSPGSSPACQRATRNCCAGCWLTGNPETGRPEMSWAFYLLPLLAPAVAAVAARPLGDRLPPRTATWLLVGGSLVLAASSSAVLALLALNAAFRIPLVAALAHMSGRVISQASPASLPGAVAAGTALAVTAGAAAQALLRRFRAITAAGRRARDLPGTGQVVVTQDAAADAYTLPGWPCRIVITDGMLRALSEPERRVLLAHERTHAAGLHYLFTSAARLAAAANPLLHPVAAASAYTVERWADEHAATDTGDRALAATAIAMAALAAQASAPAPRWAGRGGQADALGI